MWSVSIPEIAEPETLLRRTALGRRHQHMLELFNPEPRHFFREDVSPGLRDVAQTFRDLRYMKLILSAERLCPRV